MSKAPKKRSPEFKLNIVLECLKGEKTIVQIASEHQMHPKQIRRWKDKFIEEGQQVFLHKSTLKKADPDKEKLLHVISQLSLELEFLKKKLQRNH
ncbi:MAG: transposase [Verrucomicrobia bacterium]|nr:transposase [Verrucomicrobiota bacterium]